MKRSNAAHLTAIALDVESPVPLYRQLYLAVRETILAGRLAPGARLPSTRSLAGDLQVSRNTVVTAFEQLFAEGYIEGRVGAGSYVSHTLPEDLLNARGKAPAAAPPRKAPTPSRRGIYLSQIQAKRQSKPRAFSPGLPELAAFPFEEWARLIARRWRRPPMSFLVDGDPAGYRPLREAIASYLGTARAVSCSPDQILVVSGAQQALDIAARVLIDPGDVVWLEEPGYAGMRGALLAADASLVPVPVDEEGLSVAYGRAVAPGARLACVAPSHQYPLGVSMSLKRRLELLEWAATADAFVLEDDYDSEYRYEGRPLAALQGLDSDGRVIYTGSFSKVMFPALRIGYLVVPEAMIDAFRAVRLLIDTHPSSVAQGALADFIADGYLSAHIRRMRTLYAERQAALLAGAARYLDGRVGLAADCAGMHLVGYMPADCDDGALSRQAAERGVEVPALSRYYMGTPTRRGFLFGYAGVGQAEMDAALGKLSELVRDA